jgi:hypothetical protein
MGDNLVGSPSRGLVALSFVFDVWTLRLSFDTVPVACWGEDNGQFSNQS